MWASGAENIVSIENLAKGKFDAPYNGNGPITVEITLHLNVKAIQNGVHRGKFSSNARANGGIYNLFIGISPRLPTLRATAQDGTPLIPPPKRRSDNTGC